MCDQPLLSINAHNLVSWRICVPKKHTCEQPQCGPLHFCWCISWASPSRRFSIGLSMYLLFPWIHNYSGGFHVRFTLMDQGQDHNLTGLKAEWAHTSWFSMCQRIGVTKKNNCPLKTWLRPWYSMVFCIFFRLPRGSFPPYSFHYFPLWQDPWPREYLRALPQRPALPLLWPASEAPSYGGEQHVRNPPTREKNLINTPVKKNRGAYPCLLKQWLRFSFIFREGTNRSWISQQMGVLPKNGLVSECTIYIHITYIWVNYSDLTVLPHWNHGYYSGNHPLLWPNNSG